MSTFKYISDYCECGNLKMKSAEKCATCASAKPGTRYVDTCPTCGGAKTKRARQCKACATGSRNRQFEETRPWYGEEPDFDHVPESFRYLFAGFFHGEGNVHIMSNPYSLRLAIGLHSDDIEALHCIQSYFGGSISLSSTRPHAYWYKSGNLECRAVCQIILDYGSELRAIKEKDVKLAIQYVNWRLQQPHHLTSKLKAEVERWRTRMSKVKQRTSGQVISA